MRIYMDKCCYNRPMDNQMQTKIHLETEAILSIFHGCECQYWNIVGSNIIEYELSKNHDTSTYEKIKVLYNLTKEHIKVNNTIRLRAEVFQSQGFKLFDSLHLACAEYSGVDALLTVDIGFLKVAGRSNAKIRVVNPINWIMEVTSNK